MTAVTLSPFAPSPITRGSITRSTTAPRSKDASAATPRLRITRRGRLVLTTLVIGPLVTLGVVGGVVAGLSATSAVATSSSASAEFDYLTINAGESLWQVAERIAPSSDPRDVIAEIVSLNQLPTSSVEAGQRIAIPAAYAAK
jgi:hypothetical protein